MGWAPIFDFRVSMLNIFERDGSEASLSTSSNVCKSLKDAVFAFCQKMWKCPTWSFLRASWKQQDSLHVARIQGNIDIY